MPNNLSQQEIERRFREWKQERADQEKAWKARIARVAARKKNVGALRLWLKKHKLEPHDLMLMYKEMMPKRAAAPVKSKKPLHPEVRAVRKGPTAHQGGIGSRGGSIVEKRGDPALMAAIRKARMEKDWDCETVGKKLGVSGASINNWEVGRYTPKEDTRQKLVKLLGLPADLGKEATAAMAERARLSKSPKSNGAAAH